MTRIDTPWGYIDIGNNEVSVVSTVDDPPKVRLASAAGLSLGAISFNRLREDGAQVETILIQGKQDERTRDLPTTDPRSFASELTFHVNSGGQEDSHMRKVFELRSDGLWTPWTGRIGDSQ